MGLLFDSNVLDTLLAFITIAYLLYTFFTSSFTHWEDRGIPFVKPIFLFGNIKDNILNRKSMFEVHKDIYDALSPNNLGGYFEFKSPAIMIRDRELIQKILTKDFSYFHDRGLPLDNKFEPLFDNLFNAEGRYWRHLRYKLMPTFTTGKLKAMFGQISKCTDNLVTYIDELSKTESCLNSKDLTSRFSIDLIASVAFGIELNYDSEEGSLFRKMIDKVFSPSKLQLIRFSLIMYYPKLARFLKMRIIQEEVNDYFINIVKETINYRKEKQIDRNDFVQLLLTLKEEEDKGKNLYAALPNDYSEDDAVINQLDKTLEHCVSDKTKKGSESTASTISFCLYSIAANPHVERQLQNEVDTVLAKYNGELSYQAIKDMMYLEQVVNETLRQYPVGSFIFRKCNMPYKIPDSEYVIEPGTRVVIPVYAIHNDPSYYPHPEKYDPDRFSDDKKIKKGTYLPFGDGPRICIALRFAMLEVKACVASIISNFDVCVSKKTQEPIRFNPQAFTMQPVGGIWLEFHKRIKSL